MGRDGAAQGLSDNWVEIQSATRFHKRKPGSSRSPQSYSALTSPSGTAQAERRWSAFSAINRRRSPINSSIAGSCRIWSALSSVRLYQPSMRSITSAWSPANHAWVGVRSPSSSYVRSFHHSPASPEEVAIRFTRSSIAAWRWFSSAGSRGDDGTGKGYRGALSGGWKGWEEG
jgi:hypothetical protein